ncbi:MAG: molybdopterin molybdotransferase MoeA [Moraxellaceae bacterium]|nr:molybdopterin molybdotransferase MoeA [Moraxellaceae bacterium]
MSEGASYPKGLLPVEVALERLIALARARLPATEVVSLTAAAERVLAEDMRAGMAVPPEANSAMDGIAFCHADVPASGTLPLSQRIAAGHAPAPLQRGTAARIFTGAILPAGADTVAMQENCEFNGDHVHLRQVPGLGANVRPAGQDIALGSTVLTRGQRLSAPALGLLASLGITTVSVYRRLRVAILSTGDELLEPGEPWRSAAIYNSNRPMLTALLHGWGLEVIDLGRVADTQAATEAALQRALDAGADVMVSSGGVSVGDEDHVKAAVLARGRLDFWKIALKPGKPVAVGEVSGVPFIGLPGNPQSVWVTALLLARPFLLARQGQQEVLPAAFPLPVAFSREKPGDRCEYLRVRRTHAGLLPHSQQSSGALASAVWADGLAVVAAGQSLRPADVVDFLPFCTLLAP